jgi:hypothetical protein
MFKRVIRYLSRMFLPDLFTPEGCRLTGRTFVVPEDLEILDASQKRAVTICNLFSNEKQSITQIANVLDMSDRPLKPTVPVSAVYCRDEKGNSTTNSWREANQ